MTRLNAIPARAVHQPYTKDIFDKVEANLEYLVVQGPNIVAASTIQITAGFHVVTGATGIAAIQDSLGAIGGQRVSLFFAAGPTITHTAAGGAANSIVMAGLANYLVTVGEILHFIYDGSQWRQDAPYMPMRAHRHPYANNRHIEAGSVLIASGGGTASVSFTDAFASAPTVVTGTNQSDGNSTATSVGTTGFTAGSNGAAANDTVSWIAEGQD